MSTTLPRVSLVEMRRAREAAGLTQDEAASAAGIARATVQNIERGRRSPQANVLAALARAYRVPIDSLFIHEPEADSASTACGTNRPHPSGENDSPVIAGAAGAATGG